MAENNPAKIILHHSATKDSESKSFDAIRRYHIEHNGWSDIGYHLVLENYQGKLTWFQGRAYTRRGAHCPPCNFNSIGMCVVGNYDIDKLTQEHIDMILEKQKELEELYGQKMPIELHRDYTATSCPGKNITKEMFEVNDREAIHASATALIDEIHDKLSEIKDGNAVIENKLSELKDGIADAENKLSELQDILNEM